jgi:hypothetical protein
VVFISCSIYIVLKVDKEQKDSELRHILANQPMVHCWGLSLSRFYSWLAFKRLNCKIMLSDNHTGNGFPTITTCEPAASPVMRVTPGVSR